MTHLFPIYDDLVDSQSGLTRYENTTTEFVMRGLRIKESTGVEKIHSVDRGLTIFVLLKMAADHHRLITRATQAHSYRNVYGQGSYYSSPVPLHDRQSDV